MIWKEGLLGFVMMKSGGHSVFLCLNRGIHSILAVIPRGITQFSRMEIGGHTVYCRILDSISPIPSPPKFLVSPVGLSCAVLRLSYTRPMVILVLMKQGVAKFPIDS